MSRSRSSAACSPATRSRDSDEYQFDHVRHAPLPIQALPVSSARSGRRRGCGSPRTTPTCGSGSGLDERDLFRLEDGSCAATATTVGRDETQIERMVGCKLILPLRCRRGEAGRRRADRGPQNGRPPSGTWSGLATPQQVADLLTPFVELGAGSFGPQIGWPYDHETIERLIGEVVPAVDARIPA